MRATPVILQKTVQKENNRPFGENSPNLVTLIVNKIGKVEHFTCM
jgi:hypothetical protein